MQELILGAGTHPLSKVRACTPYLYLGVGWVICFRSIAQSVAAGAAPMSAAGASALARRSARAGRGEW